MNVKYQTESGKTYTLTIEFDYHPQPAILAPDPHDSCQDESELDMTITAISKKPDKADFDEITGLFEPGQRLWERCADTAIETALHNRGIT